MNFLLAEQVWWDKRQFDPPNGYEKLSPLDQKVRHIFEHTGKAIGKLALGQGTVIRREVIPDTAIYRSQLMVLFDIEPQVVNEGYIPKLKSPLQNLALALGKLGTYLEPREHGQSTSSQNIQDATIYLHSAAVDLAEQFDVSLDYEHRLRLEDQLGGRLPEDF
jgi:hypothetical protein